MTPSLSDQGGAPGEETAALRPYAVIADALVQLLGPKVEVVIHSLRSGQVAHIANPLSKRQTGDPAFLEEIDFRGGQDIIGPYEKVNWDGRVIRSISAVLRASDGALLGVVCVNFDVSDIKAAQNALSAMMPGEVTAPRPDILFKNDWHETINQFIVAWCGARGVAVDRLSRRERQDLVSEINSVSGFREKHAASYVARILGVSRATIYNDLKRASRVKATASKPFKQI